VSIITVISLSLSLTLSVSFLPAKRECKSCVETLIGIDSRRREMEGCVKITRLEGRGGGGGVEECEKGRISGPPALDFLPIADNLRSSMMPRSSRRETRVRAYLNVKVNTARFAVRGLRLFLLFAMPTKHASYALGFPRGVIEKRSRVSLSTYRCSVENTRVQLAK